MAKMKPKKVRGIHIRPAANGWSVNADHEPDGDEAMPQGNSDMVFPGHQAAAAHVAGLMAAHEGQKPFMGDNDGDEMPTSHPMMKLKHRGR